jgi:hypothetical protein
LDVAELARCEDAAAQRELCGAQLRGAQLRGAIELKSGVELKSGARRGCGEQALVIPGIAISVGVDIHLLVIHGAYAFDAATIILMTFDFLFVFAFAVVGVLLWLFPGVAFAFF